MAAGKAGATQAFLRRGASNDAILFVRAQPRSGRSFASELWTETSRVGKH